MSALGALGGVLSVWWCCAAVLLPAAARPAGGVGSLSCVYYNRQGTPAALLHLLSDPDACICILHQSGSLLLLLCLYFYYPASSVGCDMHASYDDAAAAAGAA